MDREWRLPDNLKKLRKGKKLTQEKLAAALFMKTSEISMFERNNRQPGRDKVELIADYFGVSPEDLMYGDVSYSLSLLSSGYDLSSHKWGRVMHLMFPIFDVPQSMTSENTVGLYDKHFKVYDELAKIDSMDAAGSFFYEFLDDYIVYLDGYLEILKHNKYRGDAPAANYLSVWYMHLFITRWTARMIENSVMFHEIIRNYPKGSIRTMLETIERYSSDPAFKKWIKDYISIPNYDYYHGWVINILVGLKKSNIASYVELAEYYYSLSYGFGLVDNELDPITNAKIGRELFNALELCGNSYIKNLADAM